MNKNLLRSIFALLMVFVLVGGVSAQEMTGEETDPAGEPVVDENLAGYSLEELKVATINPMNGNFMSDVWGKLTSDIDVRYLLHGYDLVRWNGDEGMFEPDDTVVSGIVVTTDGSGDDMFTIALYPDLYYSDGSRITAWDYAFSTLLRISPEVEAIGGNIRRPEYLQGYEEYAAGDVPYLSGFHVINDDMFAITIKGEFLPFFYTLGLLSTTPCPISEIAPGVRVADDGQGVYLTNESGSGDPVFTAELLEKTLLDPETGYVSHP